MELRSLRYFLAVVEAGSLSAAAADLHLSQPSLSIAMARLESQLGVELLVRSTRGVAPTEAGRHLVLAAARLLGEAEEIERTMGRFRDGSLGALTLAAVPALTWHRVPQLLRIFAAGSPDVEVHLTDPPPWTALERVRDGSADLAAVLVSAAGPFARRQREDLAVTRWGTVPIVAAFAADESTADDSPADEPVPLAALAEQVLLLPRRAAALSSLPETLDQYFERTGFRPRRIRTVDTIQTALTLAASGAGVALAPDADGASLTRFDVCTRPLSPPPPPLHAVVVSRGDASAPLPVQRLLALITADHQRAPEQIVCDPR